MHTKLVKTIIVDDEQPSREALLNYLSEFCPEVKIVAECDSAQSGYDAIRKHKPHLVFLDVEMPQGSGFDLLNRLYTIDFKIIFVTAFSSYAVQAFRFSAVDYLLKPVKVDELKEAIARVIQSDPIRSSLDNITVLLDNLKATIDEEKHLVIPHSKGFTVIRLRDIILCEADAYCTYFHLAGKPKMTSTRILKVFADMLPRDQFIRVHKSYIVNILHVQGYTFQGELLLTGDLRCPLSSTYRPAFLKVFKSPE
jgi:two-component system LytT family response regulator